MVLEIPAEWLPVCCETNRPTGAICRDCRACARNVCQEPSESPRVDISSTCKVDKNLGVSLPLLTCSPSAWPSGYCTAEVGNPGGTYELLCIFTHRWLAFYKIILPAYPRIRQQCTIFSKSVNQKGDVKHIPYWRPTNVSCLPIKFSRTGDEAPEICTVLL
jgi:hypothetical protein